MWGTSLLGTWGSSPLTRGKRNVDLSLGGVEGLIPAHAGKTDGHGGAASALRAHPRSRGENLSGWGSPGR